MAMTRKTTRMFLFAALLVGCSLPNAYGHGESIHIREDKHKEDQHHHHADQTLAVNEDEQEKVADKDDELKTLLWIDFASDMPVDRLLETSLEAGARGSAVVLTCDVGRKVQGSGVQGFWGSGFWVLWH